MGKSDATVFDLGFWQSFVAIKPQQNIAEINNIKMNKQGQKILLESLIHKYLQIISTILVFFWLIIWLFDIHNILIIKIGLGVFAIDVFLMGAWMSLGTIYRWKTFKLAHKRLDLERYLGGLGSIIYVIFGFLVCIGVVFMIFYIINTDLTSTANMFSIRKK